MPRADALIRVLRMADRLRQQRATLDELAMEFHVSVRTVRRDLQVLSSVGIPVRCTVDYNGFWMIDR